MCRSVCLSVGLSEECAVAKRLIDLDAVWGGEWGRSRYGFIRWVEIVEGVGAASGVDVEHLSYCNQWRLCGVVILCHEG